jgi:hypothetical protein
MNIQEVLRIRRQGQAVRRRAWEPLVAIYFDQPQVWYRREPGAGGWAWKPTLNDLLAVDWEIVPKPPCRICKQPEIDHFLMGGGGRLNCYPRIQSPQYEPAA